MSATELARLRMIRPIVPELPVTRPGRTGILLVNTGTPDTPDPRGVRRFLADMLSDPRLIELPRAIWLPVLHGIVLRTRPRRSARAYQAIWTPEGSPQLAIARRLRRALQARLATTLPGEVQVEIGMNYGLPSVSDGLSRLAATGTGRILVLPLYPQYGACVTGSVFDRVACELRNWRALPELRFVRDYHDRHGYIDALRRSVLGHWKTHGRGDHLLMSFHGIPRSYADRGDPYPAECHRTGELLAAALGLAEDAWTVSFQSRFGYQEWTRPYTEDTILDLGARGTGKLDVLCPGFALDCLESLEEIALHMPGRFRGAGGGSMRYIAALNESDDHVGWLTTLVRQHTAGWREEEETNASPAQRRSA